MRPSNFDAIRSDEFEKAAKKYRNAVREADRMRRSRLVGMFRAAQTGLPYVDEALRPTDEEMEAAEDKTRKAFEVLSRVM